MEFKPIYVEAAVWNVSHYVTEIPLPSLYVNIVANHKKHEKIREAVTWE